MDSQSQPKILTLTLINKLKGTQYAAKEHLFSKALQDSQIPSSTYFLKACINGLQLDYPKWANMVGHSISQNTLSIERNSLTPVAGDIIKVQHGHKNMG
jgi:hypothetical protein